METRGEAEEVRNLCKPNYINIQLMPTVVESPEYHLYFSLHKIHDTWKKLLYLKYCEILFSNYFFNMYFKKEGAVIMEF